jgi:hypothetical protein
MFRARLLFSRAVRGAAAVGFGGAAAAFAATSSPVAMHASGAATVSCEGVPSSSAGPALATEVNRLIDHTLLKPEATPADVEKLVEEAVAHQFASVCVNGAFVAHAAHYLEELGSKSVKVCAVVGFPLGASATEIKAAEAERVRVRPLARIAKGCAVRQRLRCAPFVE